MTGGYCPLVLSLSKDKRGILDGSGLREAAAGDLRVFGDGLDEHPAAAVLLGGEGEGAGAT